MALQTATKTYYAIYSSTGLELAVKQGDEKLADAELEKVIAEFGIDAKKNTSAALVNSLIQQSEMVSQYNAKQQTTTVTE